MAPPLNRLVLGSASSADDIAYIALADVSRAVGTSEKVRLIGGHMVSLLVYRWELGAELNRETSDADLGASPATLTALAPVKALEEMGYTKVAGDRWQREIPDIEVLGEPARATIDILIPSYRSRARQNVQVGDDITTIEVPGLADALRRPGIALDLELYRSSGEQLPATVVVPDEPAALGIKAFAWTNRGAGKDAVDIWRCLEVCRAASVSPRDFEDGSLVEVKDIIAPSFERMDSAGTSALLAERRLTGDAATAMHSRIRALVDFVLG